MVVALAGRRIDAPDATERRFPAEHVPEVTTRVRELFIELGARALVTSAACGADLIALGVAGDLNLRRRIILPFDAAQFRELSVVDRPGPWGEAFDRIIGEVTAAGDLRIVGSGSGEPAFEGTNQIILDEAYGVRTQLGSAAVAVVVWNGRSRGPNDFTAQFRDLAKRRRLQIYEVPTLT
jgi:hypothetical protein